MTEEIWKDVVGYEGFYMVSNLGNVRSMERVVERNNGRNLNIRTKPMKNHPHKGGYLKVRFCVNYKFKGMFVHRLVAEAFISNPLGLPQVNHKNSIRDDNRVENLEWCTARENTIHGYKYGNHKGKKGAESFHKKAVAMFDMDWNFIRSYVTMQEASKDTGTHFTNMTSCCRGNRTNAGGYRWMYLEDYEKQKKIEINTD